MTKYQNMVKTGIIIHFKKDVFSTKLYGKYEKIVKKVQSVLQKTSINMQFF